MVTIWWIFITQWFFGPPIIDRGFLLTGGQCLLAEQAAAGKVDMDNARLFLTGVACKAVGGKWSGGHDISGHVFLLVLGSMFLLEEVLHVTLRSPTTRDERTISMHDGAIKSADVETQPPSGVVVEGSRWTLATKVVLGIVGLSLYMLLMTAAYFHTWFEKVGRVYEPFKYMLTLYIAYRIGCSLQWHIRCVFPTSDATNGQVYNWNAGSVEVSNIEVMHRQYHTHL